jgi:hypothetical protein
VTKNLDFEYLHDTRQQLTPIKRQHSSKLVPKL